MPKLVFLLHEHDVVNEIDDDDWVANENDGDWVVNKFVFAVMNDMVVEVNEHVLEMMFDAFSMDFQFNVINENTITWMYHTKKTFTKNGESKLYDRFLASI